MHACGFLDTRASLLRCPNILCRMNRNWAPFRVGLSLRKQFVQVRETGVPIRLLFHSCFRGGQRGCRRPRMLRVGSCRFASSSTALSCGSCRAFFRVMRVGPCRLRRQGPTCMTRELHDAKDGPLCTWHDVPGMIESPTRTDTCQHGASFVIVGTRSGSTTRGRKLNLSRLAQRWRHRECCCP